MGKYSKVFALPMGKKQPKLNWQERQPKQKPVDISKELWDFGIFIFFIAVALFCATKLNLFSQQHDEKRELPNYQEPAIPGVFNPADFYIEKKKVVEFARAEQENFEMKDLLREVKAHFLNKESHLNITPLVYNSWYADPARFEGADTLLKYAKLNGTFAETFFYLINPTFNTSDSGETVAQFNTNLMPLLKSMEVGGCRFFSECHTQEVNLQEGDTYVNEWFHSQSETLNVTRVYFVPSGVLDVLIGPQCNGGVCLYHK